MRMFRSGKEALSCLTEEVAYGSGPSRRNGRGCDKRFNSIRTHKAMTYAVDSNETDRERAYPGTEESDHYQADRCHGVYRGENMRQVTSVVIEEVRSGEWSIGGQALTSDAVHALSIDNGAFQHDIGKMPIRESVLRKPGSLDLKEIEQMQEALWEVWDARWGSLMD